MHRFYVSQVRLNPDSQVVLTDSREIHHIKNVLRLKTGQTISLFNENGEEARADIVAIHPDEITVKIVQALPVKAKKSCQVTLACAIPKKAKFEYIIEKATELGVDAIVPLITQRTEVRLNENQARHKQSRYEKIAINAAKQCQRNLLPVVFPPCALTTFLDQKKGEATLIIPCLFGQRTHITDIFKPDTMPRHIIVLIGPEGDFTPEEVERACSCGAIPVSLGETVLKVDTAAIAVLAHLNFLSAKISAPLTNGI